MKSTKIKTLRRLSQLVFLFVVPYTFTFYRLAFLYLLVSGLISSVAVGRAFCSWVCPLGTLYEFYGTVTKKERPRYHCRIGCPYSIPIGLMNRFSLFKIRRDESKCKHCNVCVSSCPVGVFDAEIYERSSMRYACIRCLTCIGSCPNSALSFSLTFSNRRQS